HRERVAPQPTVVERSEGWNRKWMEKAALRLERRKSDVELDRFLAEESDASAILGDEREAALERLTRAVERKGRAVELHATRRGIKAHDPVRDSDLSLAREAADPQDLAPSHHEGNVRDRLARHRDAKMLDTERGVPPDLEHPTSRDRARGATH